MTAKDAFGNTATGYTGTVHFTSSDAAAILPANGTLTNGVGTFSVTLKTVGTQSITATDTVTTAITGRANRHRRHPCCGGNLHRERLPLAHYQRHGGQRHRDGEGRLRQHRHGLHAAPSIFTSSDAAAILPANATLTNGVGTFSVTLKTPGTQRSPPPIP